MVNKLDHIDDLFYADDSIMSSMQTIIGTSLLDTLQTYKSRSSYVDAFRHGHVPSALLYNMWSYLFNNMSFSVNSPYAQLTCAELEIFDDNKDIYGEYVRPCFVDIGCGNAKKWAFLVNKLLDMNVPIEEYVGFDGSIWTLKSADDILFHLQKKGVHYDLQQGNFHTYSYPDTSKTLFFAGGTFSNLWSQEQQTFLKHCYDSMQSGDTLVINAFVDDRDEREAPDISDEQLRELQATFFQAERERYERFGLANQELLWTVQQLRALGVNIGIDDIDHRMEFDPETQRLYDVRIFPRGLSIGWEMIYRPWEELYSEWIVLDRSFFSPSPQQCYKNLLESYYKSPHAHEFIYRALSRFGIDDRNSSLEYLYEDGVLSIDLHMLDDVVVDYDSNVVLRRGDILEILRSRRQETIVLKSLFHDAWFMVHEDLPVSITYKFHPEVKQTVMKSFILEK